MAFCPNCGAQVTGSFCQNCGTSMAGAGTGAGPTGPSGSAGYSAAPPPIANAPGLTTNVASALCYVFGLVSGIIFLLIAPYNQNKIVRFHAFQSIFLNVGIFAFYILWGIISAITHGFGFLLYPLFGLLFFVLWLYTIFAAYSNKMVKLPIVGDLAQKQA